MIKIIDVVHGTYSNADGVSLYCALVPYFQQDLAINLSFSGLGPMSSSFFNSSFGSLIEEFGINKFKQLIKPVEITRSQGEAFRRYISMALA